MGPAPTTMDLDPFAIKNCNSMYPSYYENDRIITEITILQG